MGAWGWVDFCLRGAASTGAGLWQQRVTQQASVAAALSAVLPEAHIRWGCPSPCLQIRDEIRGMLELLRDTPTR
jgi:hypothetical protein